MRFGCTPGQRQNCVSGSKAHGGERQCACACLVFARAGALLFALGIPVRLAGLACRSFGSRLSGRCSLRDPLPGTVAT